MQTTDLFPSPALAACRVGTLPEENEIPAFEQRTDAEILANVADALFWLTTVSDRVTISGHDGWVSVDGLVNWEHQKKVIGEVIQNVPGIRGVNNYIKLNETPEAGVILAR